MNGLEGFSWKDNRVKALVILIVTALMFFASRKNRTRPIPEPLPVKHADRAKKEAPAEAATGARRGQTTYGQYQILGAPPREKVKQEPASGHFTVQTGHKDVVAVKTESGAEIAGLGSEVALKLWSLDRKKWCVFIDQREVLLTQELQQRIPAAIIARTGTTASHIRPLERMRVQRPSQPGQRNQPNQQPQSHIQPHPSQRY